MPLETIDIIFQKANTDENIGQDGLAKAFKPLTPENREKSLNSFGGKSLKMLQDAIDEQPPLRAKEVQEIQTLVVNMVKEMEEKGDIMIVSSDEEMI